VLQVVSVDVEPLSVPLREPFVIATGRVDTTRAALVEAVLVDARTGRTGRGLGEAAALPPVTAVDQPEVLAALARAAPQLVATRFSGHAGLQAVVDALGLEPVARAAVESALLFAWADAIGVPMHRLLGSAPRDDGVGPFVVETDITIPIAEPAQMAESAARWRARGFRAFKVKVGRGVELGGPPADERALALLADRVPGARVRLDGNAGQTPAGAVELFHHALRAGLTVELLEQPTAARDVAALAGLAARLPVPVVADESAGALGDVAVLAEAGVTGFNLKLVKHGGPVAAATIGRYLRRRRLALMAGAMVETRVGLSAMLHVVRALTPRGVPAPTIDLDTAFLLASDPFRGGYDVDGARLALRDDGPRRM
jgi:L-alanine-DL-glutamate epimerase-like enolase superfamily enzyme